MTRAELTRDLDAVGRQLVLLAALVENLAFSLRSPQDGSGEEDDLTLVPVPDRGAPGKGTAAVHRTAASRGDLPATDEKPLDGTALPPRTCPPCLAERAEGRRP